MKTLAVFGEVLALVVSVASMLGPSPARAAVGSPCDGVEIASIDFLSEPREEKQSEVRVSYAYPCSSSTPISFYVRFSTSRPDLVMVPEPLRSGSTFSANTVRIPVGTVNADTPASLTVELQEFSSRSILSSRTVTFTIRDVRPSPSVLLSPLDAANELLALPWHGLAVQAANDARESATSELEGKWVEVPWWVPIAGTVVAGALRLELRDIDAPVDLSAPPGFSEIGLDGFTIEVPRGGRWNLTVRGNVRATLKIGGETVASATVPFGLRIGDARITARATLDAQDPTRPRLVGVEVQPEVSVGGDGFFPISLTPPQFAVTTQPDGTLSLRSPFLDVPLGLPFPGVGPRLRGDLVVTVHPPELRSTRVGRNFVQRWEIGLAGTLVAQVPLLRREYEAGTFSLRAPLVAPPVPDLVHLAQMVQTRLRLPMDWPPPGADAAGLGRTSPPAPDVDLGTPAEEIDAAIVGDEGSAGVGSHLPWGTLVDLKRVDGILKYEDGDSAIWTGHYLATEAFRWAATREPAALERIRVVVDGVRRLFDVTQGRAVEFQIGGSSSVAVESPGLLSKVVRPARTSIPFSDETLKLGCYYERDTPFTSLAAADGTGGGGNLWYGCGCGGTSPVDREGQEVPGCPAVSRDQYTGIFMGLGFAHALVPEVRDAVRPLVENALDFLLRNDWNVPVPLDYRIPTTFFGIIDRQLSFLRVGKSVNPGKYGPVYDRYAAAAEVAWLPVWFSTLDPMFQYYKFNLLHGSLGSALFLEDDDVARAGYMTAYAMLRQATAHHRNAYFNLVRLLVERAENRASVAAGPSGSNPDLSLRAEIQSLLGEWLERLRRVAGPNGLPLLSLPDLRYQLSLRAGDHVGTYRTLEGKESELATFALPVWGRIGRGMRFVWQKSPFDVIPASCNDLMRKLSQKQPIEPDDWSTCGGDPEREAAGVDYLLPYWMGVYLGVLPAPDRDHDGVPDHADECPLSPEAAVVDGGGCAIAQHCPCAAPREGGEWRNGRHYVACVARVAKVFSERGLMPPEEWRPTVKAARASTCGRGDHTRCCLLGSRCKVVSATRCPATGGVDAGAGSCLPNPCL